MMITIQISFKSLLLQFLTAMQHFTDTNTQICAFSYNYQIVHSNMSYLLDQYLEIHLPKEDSLEVWFGLEM